jgi:formylglycine-generating enzyme required for sulfatase activity
MNRKHFLPFPIVLLALLAAALFACGGSGNTTSSSSPAADDDASPADDDSTPADDDDDISPVALEWVSIPAGSFKMGCSPNDTQCDASENPPHEVSISAFELTKSHITQQQYTDAVGMNPSQLIACPDCPVDSVDWGEASAFCAAQGGRLPTEAEWEYAARAGTTTIYYCGDDVSCLSSIAWYKEDSGSSYQPVCQKTPNAFGLCDMLGNAWQWISDWYDANYYASSPSQDPTGPASGTLYVLRGGCWNFEPWFLRSSNRYYGSPPLEDINVGFRCAR